HEWLRPILRIIDVGRYAQIRLALNTRIDLEKFRQPGISAVGHAVLVDVAWTQIRGGHAQLARTRCHLRRASRSARTFELPTSNGIALPAWFLALRGRAGKVKDPRLSSGVGFQLQRVVILPGDVQSGRQPP